MTATQERPDYTGEFERQIFDRVAQLHAPNIPLERIVSLRDAATDGERQGLVDFYVWSTAHDLFIVQLASRAIDRLFHAEPDFQLVLARQIGDDGAHALASRERIIEISGRDEIAQVDEKIKAHWERVGEIAIRSWQGFLAWELHYEHYIQVKLIVRRRIGEIADFPFREFAENRIVRDEEVHRIWITKWWLRKFEAAAPELRAHWADEILAADEELQQALNPYLRECWDLAARVGGFDIANHVPLYDHVRREFLAFHLGKDAAALPPLTSLAARPLAQAAE